MKTFLIVLLSFIIHSPSIAHTTALQSNNRNIISQLRHQLSLSNQQTQPTTTVKPQEIPEPEPAPYSDIEVDAWYEEAAHYVLEEEIMIGTTISTFSPSQLTSRGQIATVFFSIENVEYGLYPNIFPDATYLWYQDAANWCAVHGIMFGYSYGDFAGDQPLSREELAIILYQYEKFREKDTSITEDTTFSDYIDHADVVFYAEEAVTWCLHHGLLFVTEDMIRPHDFATRAEVAYAIYHLLENT